jgi:hypothetical protein
LVAVVLRANQARGALSVMVRAPRDLVALLPTARVLKVPLDGATATPDMTMTVPVKKVNVRRAAMMSVVAPLLVTTIAVLTPGILVATASAVMIEVEISEAEAINPVREAMIAVVGALTRLRVARVAHGTGIPVDTGEVLV